MRKLCELLHATAAQELANADGARQLLLRGFEAAMGPLNTTMILTALTG